MHEVFISYSTKDVDIAESACKILESNGIKCWIAPRNEIGGKEFAEVIVDAIKKSNILLLISSSSILNSEHVLSEVAIAFDEKIIILPFKIDISQYNDNYRYYLSRKHWINAFPEPQQKLHELLETITYLLAHDNISINTKGDRGLLEISERNRKLFWEQNKEKRYSSCLSIQSNDFVDKYHRYDKIKRIDVLNSNTGNYSSYRWLELTNVSNNATNFIYHRECGETKANFSRMRVKAKLNNINGENLVVESLIDIQSNFVQVFKIHFPYELQPGETINIFYRLDWPGELMAYFGGDLSQSISLTRYICGTKELFFGVLDSAKMYDFYLTKLNSDFFEENCVEQIHLFSVIDEPEFANMPIQDLKGAYFVIKDTNADRLYRLKYKVIQELDKEDIF